MIVLSGNLSKNFSQREYHAGSATVYMTKETIVFVRILQAFRKWIKTPMYVVSWARTKQENINVGGIATSNHLQPRSCAIDWKLNNKTITKALFIQYATKWAELCRASGTVGEAGLYEKGWVHFGVQNEAQAKSTGHKFVHWYTDKNGKQTNNPFPELRGL